jgi:plasmid stabilization system protein ParE
MPTVDWTRLARDDLRGINTWLTERATPEVALAMLIKVRLRAQSLAEFPHGGRPYRGGTRILRVYGSAYLIRYRIVSEGVQILRVHHERENWSVDR